MNIYLMKKPKRINSVSVSMFLGLLLFVYLLYWWIPILWPIFQMTGIMKNACGEAYRNVDDRVVMEKLLTDAQRTKLKISENNFRFRRIKYSRDELASMNIEEDTFVANRGKHCEIAFHYEDDYPVPFIGLETRLVFERTIDAPLVPVKYEKLCTCVTVPGSRP